MATYNGVYKKFNGSTWDTIYLKTTASQVIGLQEALNPYEFFIEGNSSGTAGTWTGVFPSIVEYKHGMSFLYKIQIAGASTTTLNINGLGAKTVYRYGTTKVTTQYPVNSIVKVIYDANSNGGCFYTIADYDANNYDRIYSNNVVQIKHDPLYRYKLLGQTTGGTWAPLFKTNKTSTTKVTPYVVSDQEFLINGRLEFYNATATVAIDGTVSNKYIELATANLVPYSLNETSLTIHKFVYLVGTKGPGGGFKIDSSNFVTQDLPSTDNGKLYMLLGYMYSSTSIRFYAENPVFHYKEGSVRRFSPDPTIPSIPNVSITNGTVESGKYISAISASGHTITITKANLPAGYTLPLAGSSRGGIKAATKGAGDTVEVKIDNSTEKLYVPTYPSIPSLSISGGGLGLNEYIASIEVSGHSITATKGTLHLVASTGSYNDLKNKPAAYTLPLAGSSLGGIKAATKGAGDTVEVKIDTSSQKLYVPTYPTVPNVSITNGTVESGKYISALSVSGHTITVTKTDLPGGGWTLLYSGSTTITTSTGTISLGINQIWTGKTLAFELVARSTSTTYERQVIIGTLGTGSTNSGSATYDRGFSYTNFDGSYMKVRSFKAYCSSSAATTITVGYKKLLEGYFNTSTNNIEWTTDKTTTLYITKVWLVA